MKYAVYWQPDKDVEIAYYKTIEEAKAKLAEVKARCEQKMEHWDITLLKVIGDVIQTPGGLTTLLYE